MTNTCKLAVEKKKIEAKIFLTMTGDSKNTVISVTALWEDTVNTVYDIKKIL